MNRTNHTNQTGSLRYALFLLLTFLIISPAQAAWTVVDSLTGGDVTAVVRDGTGNIYIGTDGGGVFKSTDSGQNWTSVNNGLPDYDLHVRSLAMDSSGNLYAGGFASYGLFKSTDGGQNWTHLTAINGTIIDLTVTVLHIDSSDTVFAGSRGSTFYRSTDGGSTWGLISGIAYVDAITSTGSAHFAVTFSRGVYTSTDGGLNWSYVVNVPSDSNTQATAIVADGANLYVSTEKKQKGWNTTNVGVYKSTDSGANWTAMTTGLTDGNNRGYEVFALSVAGTDTLYGTAMSVSDGDYRIVTTTDGGTNWSTASLPMVKGLALLTAGSEVWAGMQDSGVHYRNTSGTWSWRNAGLTAVHVESLLGAASGNLIVGSSDLGISKSADNSSNWTTGLLRLGRVIGDMVEDASGNLYAGTDGYDSRSNNVLFKSANDGDTWTAANSGIPYTDVNALEIDSSGTLYAGTYPNGIYQSTDGAANWNSAAAGGNMLTASKMLATPAGDLFYIPSNNRLMLGLNGVTTGDTQTKGIFQDNAGNLYAFSGTNLRKSSDGGTNWSNPVISSGSGEANAFLDDGAGTLYFATRWQGMNGIVYSSTDGGNNWADVSTGLGNTEVLSLMVAANGTVYAGTNGGGLYRMTAGGGGDTTDPVVTAPANITVAADSATGTPASNAAIAAFLAAATATDNVAVVGGITNDAPTTFAAGTTTTVTFTAVDAAGNSGTATATVTINAFSSGGGTGGTGGGSTSSSGGGGGGSLGLPGLLALLFATLGLRTRTRRNLGLGLLATGIVLLTGCASAPKAPASFDANNYASDKAGYVQRYVKVKDADELKALKRVVIPSFQVEFITQSSATASAVGGFGSKGGARASSTYKLAGLDEAALQAVTDKLYNDLMQRLKNSGVEVVSLDQLQGNDAWPKLVAKGAASPSRGKSRLEPDSGESLVFAPTGMGIYYSITDPKIGLAAVFGGIGATNKGTNPGSYEGRLMEAFSAAMLKARYVVSFAQISTEGGTFSKTAGVSANWRFALAPRTTELVIFTEFDKYKAPFADTMVYRPKPDESARVMLGTAMLNPAPFVQSVEDVTPTSGKVAEGVFNVLSILGGSGSTSKTREYKVSVDASVYQQRAEQYISAMSEMFVERMKGAR